jgi:hypothetical protein
VQPREIPQAAPTLLCQIPRAASERFGAPWDLAIVCASINDVDVKRIFNPVTSTAEIDHRVDHYCRNDLAKALDRLRTELLPTNPALIVAVLGYYPVVSEQSTRIPPYESIVRAFLGVPHRQVQPQFLAVNDPIRARLVQNSLAFARASALAIASAVEHANALGAPIFRFVDPAFGEDHASMTADPYVWGMDDAADPTDELAPFRKDVCWWGLGRSGADYFLCARASVGHPNVAGAARYADRIDAIAGPLVFDLTRRKAIAARSASEIPPPVH